MPNKSVVISGAGISGLTAAINLAKAGYPVTVYEKLKNSGQRFLGDLQGIENWTTKQDALHDLKKMNLRLNFDYSPFREMTFTNGKKEIELKSRTPIFYLVKRGKMKGTLDQGLRTQAEVTGAKLVFGSAKKEKEADIVATGPDTKRAYGIVGGFTFETELDDTAVILANDKISYKGYSYLLISKGYGCVCSVVVQRVTGISRSVRNTVSFFKKRYDLKLSKQTYVGGIGNFGIGGKFANHDRLYVGEAAGLQDTLWGFGIRSSMQSGYLAAISIIKSLDYGELARKKFEGYTKALTVARFMWELSGNRDYSSLFRILNGATLVKKCAAHIIFHSATDCSSQSPKDT